MNAVRVSTRIVLPKTGYREGTTHGEGQKRALVVKMNGGGEKMSPKDT